MKRPGEAIRAFIALEIPQGAQQVLSATILHLQLAVPRGVRWADPSGIHLTLKFLGDIDPNLVGSLLVSMQTSAQGVARFQLTLSELGVFPNARQPRVLWAGVDGDVDRLKDLQRKMDDAVSTLGLAREKRPFHPHLTLGRVRDGISAAVIAQIGATISSASLASSLGEGDDPSVSPPTKGGLKGGASWTVDSLHLIRSTLAPAGAIYTSLASAPLWTK